MKLKSIFFAAIAAAALVSCETEVSVAPNTLKVGSDSITADAAGTTTQVAVNCTCDWNATSDASWIEVSPMSARRNTTSMTVIISENTDSLDRTAKITVKAVEDTLVSVISVTQTGVKPVKPDVPGKDKYTITSADDFAEFMKTNAADAVSGETYKLDADIDMAGAVLSPVVAFDGYLNGQGHKVYNYKVESTADGTALFLTLNGTLDNIVFGSKDGETYDGTSLVTMASGAQAKASSAAVVAVCAGTMKDVKNFATLTVDLNTSALSGFGGICGFCQTASTFSGCVNGGQLNVTGTTAAETYEAGVVAYVNNATALIDNCKNVADLTFTLPIKKASMFGGVVGRANLGATVSNCSNTGKIEYAQAEAPANYIMIAGIIGAVYTGSICTNCTNSGEVKSNLQQVNRCGGICGTLNTNCEVSGCTNSGNVTVSQAEANGNWEAVAGIVGFQEKGAENKILNNTNTGNVTLKVENTTTHANKVAVAGIIGTTALATTISGNVNKGTVTLVNAAAGTAYAGGIAGFVKASASDSFSGNENTGAVSCSTSDDAASNAGGMFGILDATNTSDGDKSVAAVTCKGAAGAAAGTLNGEITGGKVGGSVNGAALSASNASSLAKGAGSGTATVTFAAN